MRIDNIKTPDGNTFSISLASKYDSDELERRYKENAIDKVLLSASSRSAFLIDNKEVLYRQFYADIGFLFPTIKDYQKAIQGDTYFDTNIQLDKNDKIRVAFILKPDKANYFSNRIIKELTNYQSFEGRQFYLLNDSSIIMIRKRTSLLSDGYWFESLSDFEHFYYILSGLEK